MLMSVIFEYNNSNKPVKFGVPNYTTKPYVFHRMTSDPKVL